MRLQSVTLFIGVVLACHVQAVQRTRTQGGLNDAYRGPVEVSVMDDLVRGVSTTIYRFQRDGREVTAYQLSADAPPLRCGDIVSLEGIRLGDTMAVSKAQVSGRAADDAACSPIGEQRVAVILAAFPGATRPAASASRLRSLLFDEDGLSVNTWYREKSYAKVSLSGEVFGPYTLDRSYDCGQTAQMRAAAIQAADRDIDFTQFQRYILVFPSIPGCVFGAMGTLGCSALQTNDGNVLASWIWSNDSSDSDWLRSILAHELGHNFGLGHSRQLRIPGEALAADDHRAVPVEYGDQTSAMGQARYGDFAAAHKLAMGWLQPDSDVATVETGGEFMLATLGSESGSRALRVRRRAGEDEWLWIEYRRPREEQNVADPAFDGVLIRRETPASGTCTHLLDMTPASLDEARYDLGRSSESRPELPPGSTWVDPHSDLTISVGEAGDEGIPVVVRYTDRCAIPEQREVVVSAEEQEFTLPVSVSEGCEWETLSGRSWLSVSRDGNQAVVKVSAVTGDFHRTGVVSVGRHAVRIIQKGPLRDMQILSVSPPGSEMPVNAPVPFLFYLRDDNGADDMQAIQLSVLPRPESTAAPCYFRYSSVLRAVEISDDGVEFRDDESPAIGRSGSCSLEAKIFQPNSTDAIFRFSLQFSGAEGEMLSLNVRAEDAGGVAGPWTQAAAMNTVGQCSALPTIDYFRYLSGGGVSQNLPIRVSASPCAWSAISDSNWIRLATFFGSESGNLLFDVEANPDSTTREGRILVNGAPVRIIQFGNGEIRPEFVTLRPAETVVSSLAGVGALTFFYGLGDLIPAESEAPWIRVLRVERSADRREVLFYFEDNPEPAPRLGVVRVGGKPFTVLQQAARVDAGI